MKKVIAFDLDGTLAPSKSPLPDKMAEVLNQLLDLVHVCVISGGKFELFERQLLPELEATTARFKKLHIMPTCGTRYYRYNINTKKWDKIYAEDFIVAEKNKITKALKKGVTALDLWEKQTWGETIEDRDSQISYSALGQEVVAELGEEGIKLKENWDPDNSKKNALVEYVKPLLPEFEVRAGGLTTVDVTKLGIDKAYGMKKLMKHLGVSKKEILFIGDRIIEGGNDYPVKLMGIDSVQVSGWQDTVLVVQTLIYTL